MFPVLPTMKRRGTGMKDSGEQSQVAEGDRWQEAEGRSGGGARLQKRRGVPTLLGGNGTGF